jgi:anti-sigma factor RsiW
MDDKTQLKLQAWLDGELPEAEAREAAAWVARDREGAALAEELRNTRQALAGFEADVRLPESREFYWSKIAREIERLEAPPPKAAPQGSPWAVFLRWLVPVSAVAMVVVGGLVFTHPAAPPVSRTTGAVVETALADAGVFTYRDFSAGTTLVWVSYPADNEIAPGDGMGTVN